MEAIELKDLTDEQFSLYLNLLIEIRNKFQEGSLLADDDWSEYQVDYLKINNAEEFKAGRLKNIEERKNFSLKEFVFFENEKPVAWIAFKRVTTDRYEFIFESEFESLPKALTEALLITVRKYLSGAGIDQITFWTHDDRKKDSFKNAGMEIYLETINSKLYKKDIDFGLLEKIVNENKAAENYELRLLHEFPEELYDEFVEIMHEVNIESRLFDPRGSDYKGFTRETLMKMIEQDKEDGDPMYMYVLFDNENNKDKIAAFCRVYIEKDSGNYFIQHCGGLTGVGKNYRGNGFAKYLKAKMYLKILEDYPDFEYAKTDTYPWNKYMYKINEEMGFKPSEIGISFGFTKEFLENHLK